MLDEFADGKAGAVELMRGNRGDATAITSGKMQEQSTASQHCPIFFLYLILFPNRVARYESHGIAMGFRVSLALVSCLWLHTDTS
jgi:hypothetical protein